MDDELKLDAIAARRLITRTDQGRLFKKAVSAEMASGDRLSKHGAGSLIHGRTRR
jgi:hypothetical protein